MLNFDPHRWIADHEIERPAPSVATVAGVAAAQLEIENSVGLEFHQKPQTSADFADDARISILEVVPATVATPATDGGHERAARARLAPALILRKWQGNIAGIDACCPPEGWPLNRWQQLCDDAAWLLANFGEQAARDGWSSADLFGLWPDKPHWGGITDRLRGARSLVFTADRAHWRAWGQIERFNRGSYPDLRLFWERI